MTVGSKQGCGPDPCVLVRSGPGFQGLIGSGFSLNIKVYKPSKIELSLQYLLTKVIIQNENINYIYFHV